MYDNVAALAVRLEGFVEMPHTVHMVQQLFFATTSAPEQIEL